MAKMYNIFISHSWAYVADLRNLRNLLESRSYFNVDFQEATPDEPINSVNAYYIKQRLRTRILASNCLLGIAGIYASYSDWMGWELETASNSNIPIIGVVPRGQERISSVVNNYSIVNVRWNTESIVDAIRNHAI